MKISKTFKTKKEIKKYWEYMSVFERKSAKLSKTKAGNYRIQHLSNDSE